MKTIETETTRVNRLLSTIDVSKLLNSWNSKNTKLKFDDSITPYIFLYTSLLSEIFYPTILLVQEVYLSNLYRTHHKLNISKYKDLIKEIERVLKIEVTTYE